MFYMMTLTKELEVHPRFFGPKLSLEIQRRLKEEVEGTCNGKYGFILAVFAVLETGRGLIREGSGAAVFNLKYSCICMKPFKGEVMDVVVTSVNKVRCQPRWNHSVLTMHATNDTLPLLPCTSADGLFCRSGTAAGICVQPSDS